jgi:hypothetical protein
MMEAVRTSETSAYSKTTRRFFPEGSNFKVTVEFRKKQNVKIEEILRFSQMFLEMILSKPRQNMSKLGSTIHAAYLTTYCHYHRTQHTHAADYSHRYQTAPYPLSHTSRSQVTPLASHSAHIGDARPHVVFVTCNNCMQQKCPKPRSLYSYKLCIGHSSA